MLNEIVMQPGQRLEGSQANQRSAKFENFFLHASEHVHTGQAGGDPLGQLARYISCSRNCNAGLLLLVPPFLNDPNYCSQGIDIVFAYSWVYASVRF